MTTQTAPIHDFDPAALLAYLHRHVDGLGDKLRLRQISGGQSNPTYFIPHSPSKSLISLS